jgi:GT2 family glycosyltransferase
MCSEEVDLCKRVHDLGGSVVYAPEVTLVHVGAASHSGKDLRVRWWAAGRVRYTRKHFGRVVLLAARLGAVAAYLSSLLIWIKRWLLHRITWHDVRVEARRYGRALLEAWRT